MPTVHREGPYRFYFYSHESSEPPHIHVDGGASTAKIWLTPIRLARNHGFSAREIAAIMAVTERHHRDFLEAWHGFFGTRN